MRLEGKVAVITGAGSEVGRDTALKYARLGAKVLVSDLSGDRGKHTVQEICSLGLDAEFIQTEVRLCKDAQNEISRSVRQFDTLVMMFGYTRRDSFSKTIAFESSDYDRVVRINEESVLHGVLSAGYRMHDLESIGVILNAAAVCRFLASRGTFGYYAKKGAIKLRLEAAALELAPYLNPVMVPVMTPVMAPAITQTEVVPTIQLPSLHIPTQQPNPQANPQHLMLDQVLTHAQMQARHQIPKTSLGTPPFLERNPAKIEKGGENTHTF
jgi:glucose 1-dehydrogenase